MVECLTTEPVPPKAGWVLFLSLTLPTSLSGKEGGVKLYNL